MEAEGRAGSGTMVWLGALRDTEKVILASDWSRQIFSDWSLFTGCPGHLALGVREDGELHLLGGGPAQQLQPGAELRRAGQPAGLALE